MSAAFDTVRLARTLRDKAHFSAEQAEGMADAIAEALHTDVATKADLRSVKDELKSDVRSVRDELKADLRQTELRLEARIEASKNDFLKWVVGMIGFQTVVLLGAALALARVLTR